MSFDARELFAKALGEGRVVGGTPADGDRFPYHGAMLSQGGFQFCGGGLIAPNVFLTASHCLDVPEGQGPAFIALNCPDLTDTDDCVIGIVDSFFLHPQYVSDTFENDVGIVILSQDVGGIEPLIVPTDNFELFDGQDLLTIGHGTTSFGGQSSDILLQAELEVANIDFCEEQYKTVGSIQSGSNREVSGSINPDVMFCTIADQKDACQGDSGGSIISTCDVQGEPDLVVGTVSFGVGCAYEGIPGVLGTVFTTSAFEFINFHVTQQGHTLNTVDSFDEFCVVGGTQPPDQLDANPTPFPTFDPDARFDWVCARDFFAAGDGCDCGCGLPDPDCEFDDNVFGCGIGGRCDADGECEGGLLGVLVGSVGSLCIIGIVVGVGVAFCMNQRRNSQLAKQAMNRHQNNENKQAAQFAAATPVQAVEATPVQAVAA